jgi:hypothetical protein
VRLWTTGLLALVACSRQLPELQSPTPLTVERPQAPPNVQLRQPRELIVTTPALALELLNDVCANARCVYQTRGGSVYADFTDVQATNGVLQVPLDRNRPNRVFVRTRSVDGSLVSEENFVAVLHDDVAPQPPAAVHAEFTDGDVRVSWLASPSDDVLGYNIYYGTSADRLDGAFAAKGASPIFVAKEQKAVTLTGVPPGTSVFVAASAVDRAKQESGRVASAQPAVPTVVANPLQIELVSTYAQTGNREARAVATDGDLIVLISVDKTDENALKTVIETFSLAALASGAATPLGTLELNEWSQVGCGFPAGEARSTSLKQIQIYDRYLFIASGTGNLFIVDVVNPSAPVIAFRDTGLSGSVYRASLTNAGAGGCAYGFFLEWPYLWIADGTADDAPTPFNGIPDFADDTSNGGIVLRRLRPYGENQNTIEVLDEDVCRADSNPTARGYGDTARRILSIESGMSGGTFGDRLYFETTYDTSRCEIGNGFPAYPHAEPTPSTPRCNLSCASSQLGKEPGVSLLHEPPRLYSAPTGNPLRERPLGIGAVTGVASDFASALPIFEVGSVWQMAPARSLLFVAQSSPHGVGMIDASAKRLLASLPTMGDARGVAVSGPYVAVADAGLGLSVWRYSRTSALTYKRSYASTLNVAASGARALVGESDRLSTASLVDSTIVPGVGGTSGLCGAVAIDGERAACVYDPAGGSERRPCLTTTLGGGGAWPPLCFGQDAGTIPTNVAALSIAGPELLFAYDHAPDGPSLRVATVVDFYMNMFGTPSTYLGVTVPPGQDGIVFAPRHDGQTGSLVVLPAAARSDGVIARGPGLAAVETLSGVSLVSRSDRNALSVVRSHLGLQAPVLTTSELCGIQAGSIVCFALTTGAQTRSLVLPATSCTRFALARSGGAFAVQSCDRVHVVEAGVPTRSVSISARMPSIAFVGDGIYVSCTDGLCELEL